MERAQRAGGADRGVGGLDQQSAGVSLAGPGDMAVAGRFVAGLAHARVQAEISDEVGGWGTA